MNPIKKLLLAGCLIGCASIAVGAAAWTDAERKTANAEAVQTTQSYETEDVFFMARVTNVYAPNGNFNLTLSMSNYDASVTQSNYVFSKELAPIFNEFGFFDKVKMRLHQVTRQEYR